MWMALDVPRSVPKYSLNPRVHYGSPKSSKERFELRVWSLLIRVPLMSPIEEYWVALLQREIAARGFGSARVSVFSAETEHWRFGVALGDRAFELGFNHREHLWCHETTPGREKCYVSNDWRSIPTSAAAREAGLRLLRVAIQTPELARRDPPVI